MELDGEVDHYPALAGVNRATEDVDAAYTVCVDVEGGRCRHREAGWLAGHFSSEAKLYLLEHFVTN